MRQMRRKTISVIVIVAFVLRTSTSALAEAPVKMTRFTGTIEYSTSDWCPFTLEGTASHIGAFTARGEVRFGTDDQSGGHVGHGVAVFTAADGSQLVADVTWNLTPGNNNELIPGEIHFAWRDSVQFHDGTLAASNGRFETDRPPGLVVIAIIAILIGLLLPAVQKSR